MKKRLIAVILMLALSTMFFAACGIITKNVDRDYAQIIAEVGYDSGNPDYVLRQKNDNGEYVEGKKKVTKRQLVLSFENQASNLLQNMTVREAFEYLLNQLIRNEIIIQEAIRVIAKNENVSGTPKIEDCLTSDEIKELEQMTYDIVFEDINSKYKEILIGKGEIPEDSTETDKDLDHDHEHLDTSRVTQSKVGTIEDPYEAKYDKSKEPTDDNWKAAVVEYNNSLNDKEKGLDKEKYYTRILNSQMEQKVYEKYQEIVEDNALKEWLDKEDVNYLEDSSKAQSYVTKILESRYNTERNSQIEQYSNNVSAFVEALDGDKLTNILYIPQIVKDNINNKTEPYFYTQNLLVKYSDKLQKEIDDINAKNISNDLKGTQKLKVLEDLYAEDIRSVFEVKEQTVYEKTGNIVRREVPKVVAFPTYMPFTGELIPKSDFNAETYYDAKYKEYLLEDATTSNSAYSRIKITNGDFLTAFNAELRALSSNSAFISSDYYNKSKTAAENAFMTLIFKYGNDPGMFNNDAGYIIKPTTNGTASSYVVEYQVASVKAFDAFMQNSGSLQDKQLASIQATPSDNGYHVIMCTGILEEKKIENNAAQILIDFKNSPKDQILGYEKTFAYTYNQTIQKELKDKAFSTEQTKLVQVFEAKSGFVTKYVSRYQDLLNLK